MPIVSFETMEMEWTIFTVILHIIKISECCESAVFSVFIQKH